MSSPSFMVLKNCLSSLESTETLPPKLLLQHQKPVFVEEALPDIFGISLSKKTQDGI